MIFLKLFAILYLTINLSARDKSMLEKTYVSIKHGYMITISAILILLFFHRTDIHAGPTGGPVYSGKPATIAHDFLDLENSKFLVF